jgi:hypothetical protein
MRAKISTDAAGRVTVAYDDGWSGERVERTFWCAVTGGYVWEMFEGGNSEQVCEGLSRTGATLRTRSRDTLADTIRREYRALRQYERKEMAR